MMIMMTMTTKMTLVKTFEYYYFTVSIIIRSCCSGTARTTATTRIAKATIVAIVGQAMVLVTRECGNVFAEAGPGFRV